MKKIILTGIIISTSIYSQAQIAIGKNDTSSPSVSLEFAETENRGLLLPWVNNETALKNAELGTLVFDAEDKKVKVKYDTGWEDLSIKNGTTTFDGIDALDSQNYLEESAEAKVSIGNPTNAEGILVLEDIDKAMILPKVESPHENIMNPTPGLMVYDPNTKEFAVFNGEVWTYWKASE